MDIASMIERRPFIAVSGAIIGGFALFVAMHGGKLSSLSGVSRGLKGQVSNQKLLGVATDVQPTDAAGYADITMLNNYFAILQKRLDDEAAALEELRAQQAGGVRD